MNATIGKEFSHRNDKPDLHVCTIVERYKPIKSLWITAQYFIIQGFIAMFNLEIIIVYIFLLSSDEAKQNDATLFSRPTCDRLFLRIFMDRGHEWDFPLVRGTFQITNSMIE